MYFLKIQTNAITLFISVNAEYSVFQNHFKSAFQRKCTLFLIVHNAFKNCSWISASL